MRTEKEEILLKRLSKFLDRMKELERQGLINLSDYCDPPETKPISYSNYITTNYDRIEKIDKILDKLNDK